MRGKRARHRRAVAFFDMLRKLDNVVAENLEIAKWSDEAIDGLGKLLKKITLNGEDVARRVLSRYGDDVAEATFKGINKGVIDDLYKVDAEKLARYVDLNKKYFSSNGIDDGLYEHRLKQLFNGKADTIFEDEVIPDAISLKNGKHYGPDNGFGWEHIETEHPELFNHWGDEDGIIDKVKRTVKTKPKEYTPGVEYKFESRFTDIDGNERIFKAIVSDDPDGAGRGTIISAFDTAV